MKNNILLNRCFKKLNNQIIYFLAIFSFTLLNVTISYSQSTTDWVNFDNIYLGRCEAWLDDCPCLICSPRLVFRSGTEGVDWEWSAGGFGALYTFGLTWLRPGTYDMTAWYLGGVTGISYCSEEFSVTIGNHVKDSICKEESFSINNLVYYNSQYSSKASIILSEGFHADGNTSQYFRAFICESGQKSTITNNTDNVTDRKVNDPSSENYGNKVICYPNPSNGIFTIELPNEEPGMLKIFNPAGQSIFEKKILSGDLINLSSFPKGCYYTVISTKENTFREKVIVK